MCFCFRGLLVLAVKQVDENRWPRTEPPGNLIKERGPDSLHKMTAH